MPDKQRRESKSSGQGFVQRNLEKLIGTQRFDKLKKTRSYKFIVEAVTMNLFSFAITTPNELLIAGMDFDEFIKTRLASIVINTVTGRPYGVWRDSLLDRMGIGRDSHFAVKYLYDTLAFVSFQLPLYWLSMFIGGAELDEMVKASLPLIFISGMTGRPYGFFLDKFRFQCGLSSKTT
jgi:hypothetical protein